MKIIILLKCTLDCRVPAMNSGHVTSSFYYLSSYETRSRTFKRICANDIAQFTQRTWKCTTPTKYMSTCWEGIFSKKTKTSPQLRQASNDNKKDIASLNHLISSSPGINQEWLIPGEKFIKWFNDADAILLFPGFLFPLPIALLLRIRAGSYTGPRNNTCMWFVEVHVCSCCCLPLLPKLVWSILATT